jgi:plasmid stability protein
MPSLTIRNIPAGILEKMRRAAKTEQRSVNSQAIRWLEQSAKQWSAQDLLPELLEDIRAARESIYRRHGRGTNSAQLTRILRLRAKP